MTRPVKFNFRIALLAVTFAITARAQVTPPAGSLANQVPLSGRPGQGGSVSAGQSPVAGTTNSVNTINPTIQVQGPFSGSVPGGPAISDKLSLQDAVKRGLEYNLGTRGLTYAMRQARGEAAVVRIALMPNVNGSLAETVQQTNLRAEGFRISAPIPGFSIPSIVGPFQLL